jgi:hypothetical protein
VPVEEGPEPAQHTVRFGGVIEAPVPRRVERPQLTQAQRILYGSVQELLPPSDWFPGQEYEPSKWGVGYSQNALGMGRFQYRVRR